MTLSEALHRQDYFSNTFVRANNIGIGFLSNHSTSTEQLNRHHYATGALLSSLIEIGYPFNRMNSSISPTILGIAQFIGGYTEVLSPSAIGLAQQTLGAIQPVSPLFSTVNEAAGFIRGIDLQISPIFDMLGHNNVCLSDLNDLAISLDAIESEYAFDIDYSVAQLDSDEKTEIEAAISNVMSQPSGWQHRLVTACNRFNDKNPILAKLFIVIMTALLTILCGVASTLIAETIKKSVLREEPSITSSVVTDIEVKQTVYIINQAPYYFEVEFQDEKTNVLYNGWISKRSLKLYDKYNDKSTLDIYNE